MLKSQVVQFNARKPKLQGEIYLPRKKIRNISNFGAKNVPSVVFGVNDEEIRREIMKQITRGL